VTLAHAMSNTVGGLIAIPDSYLLYQNWALLIVVLPIVLIFGPKDLLRRRRGEEMPQARVPAIGT